jgi:hypothetical protein
MNSPTKLIKIMAINPANKVPPRKEKSLFDLDEYKANPPNITVVTPNDIRTITEPIIDI